MKFPSTFLLLGLALIAIGIVHGGWTLLCIWLGINFIILGIAHFRNSHGIFGKRADGILPLWSWLIFWPFLLFTNCVWHLFRLTSRGAPHNTVSDEMVIGRRLLAHKEAVNFANYVDLTAEYSETSAIRNSPGYLNFSILDGSAPHPQFLHDAIDRLRPGLTYIHCAQGYGRTALFALAMLLKSGSVKTVDEGIAKLKSVRPGIHLTTIQRKCIQKFAASLQPPNS